MREWWKPREQTLPEVVSPEPATISGSSLADIYQFLDVQREFGEENQQAPIVEEVNEFGVSQFIQTQSLLDHEMAETSHVEDMCYLQSQMQFEESVESTADSDLEDGELQKLLTSQLFAQKSFW